MLCKGILVSLEFSFNLHILKDLKENSDSSQSLPNLKPEIDDMRKDKSPRTRFEDCKCLHFPWLMVNTIHCKS